MEIKGNFGQGLKQYEFQHWTGRKVKCYCRDNTIDYNTYQSAIHHDEYGFGALGLKRFDTIIDIGSYIGGEGIELCAMGFDFRIYSYDPLQENLALYNKNMEYLKFNGVKMFCQAVGGEHKTVKFNLTPSQQDRFVGNVISGERPGCVDVQMVTLDDIFNTNRIERCNVLKMDCEGTEMDILKTSKHLFDRIDWIVGETHGQGLAATYDVVKDKFTNEMCDYRNETDGISLFRFKHR